MMINLVREGSRPFSQGKLCFHCPVHKESEISMHDKDVPQVEESAVTRPLLADEGPCCQYGTDVSSSEPRQPERQKPAGERQDTASMPTWSMTKGVQAHNEQRNKQASSLPDSLPPPIHNSHQAMNTADRQLHGTRTQSSEEPLIQHVIVVHNTTPIPTVVCPYCHRGPSPTIQYKASGFCTWFTASLCCFVGCCILFPFVFCCDSLKDTVHYCSHCRRYLGRTPA